MTQTEPERPTIDPPPLHPRHAHPRVPTHRFLKRLLVGRPLATHELGHQRLTKRVALAVFSSDAVSSTAYGTEVILSVLVPAAGMAALHYVVPISLVVMGLLVVLVFSYRQTIYAYPGGGGSYVVSRENLGTTPSLVAAASLLVDYTLNVAVSVAAGVAAITSAIVGLRGHPVLLSLILLALITTANLRGVRESGRIFAVPVYAYVLIMLALIVWGLGRSLTGHLHTLPVDHAQLAHFTGGRAVLGGVTVFLLLRAFASGAVALSGVEAISNGVPSFRAPEPRNAAITLAWTGTILGGIFFGVALLAVRLKPTLSTQQTILSTMGRAVFGHSSPLYGVLQAATALILCLSANTSFSGFPGLASVVARDGFLPHQLATRGDRLVYSNGIVGLAAAAGLLLVGFRGNLNSLIPLFAVGLFSAFTLAQAGMVRHHQRLREPGWRLGIAVNAVGCAATMGVLGIVVVTKFTEGAWIPVVVIPAMVMAFRAIHRHYTAEAEAEALAPGERPPVVRTTVVVPVGSLDRAALWALAFAESLHPDRIEAVCVAFEAEDEQRIRAAWAEHEVDVPLTVVSSPYRDLTYPILDFVDGIDTGGLTTVIIPQTVRGQWWEQFLHNQTALALTIRLLFRPNTVVVSVPTHLATPRQPEVAVGTPPPT